MIYEAMILAFLSLSAINESAEKEFVIRGFAQGTSYTVKYVAVKEVIAKSSLDSIFSEIDSSMSLYKPFSLISRFNSSENGLIVDGHFKRVVERALEISQDTDGKFDITIAPLAELWGSGKHGQKQMPDSIQIENLLPCIGFTKISLHKDFLKKEMACTKIDMNGIAQGYTVDLIGQYLSDSGLKDFMVEVGGEIKVKGVKADGRPFRVGIRSLPDLNENQAGNYVVNLKSGALTTSGKFNPSEEENSRRVSHHIDPKSGRPVQGSMLSVTVYSSDAMTADGYDNALMAMDITEATEFVEKRDYLAACFIYKKSDGSIATYFTKRFKQLLN